MPISPRVAPARLLLWVAAFLASVLSVHAAAAGFDPVAETARYLSTLPAEQRARSDAYFEGGYWLILWDAVIAIALIWFFARLGLFARMRDLAERAFRARFLQGMVFIGLVTMGAWLVTLPWDYYESFVREHQYGLSNLSFGGWLGERATGLLPGLILGCPVGSLLYLGLQRFPRNWWVAAGVATPFFITFFLVVTPVFIAPLFNTYTPLADARVRDPILSMARANGVPVDNVYQFDASKQTKRISANVSGALNTVRVSLNDNLLSRCSPAAVQAVMGHELGHYVLNHVYKLIIYLSLVWAASFAFTHWFFGGLHRRWGAAWGVRGPGDFAGLPLLAIAMIGFQFLATPVVNTIVRTTEEEADIFGLNAARQPEGFVEATLLLSEYRKLAPGRWEEILFFDHPSGYHRILMSMRWKAEHLTDPPPAPPASTDHK